MKPRSLLTQVLAVNLLLVAATVLVATVAVDFHAGTHIRGREVVLGLATAATLAGNWLLLRRRFQPLDRMISKMEEVDLAATHPERSPHSSDSAEVERLNTAFHRMIAVSRPSAERRGGRRFGPRSASGGGSPRTFTTR